MKCLIIGFVDQEHILWSEIYEELCLVCNVGVEWIEWRVMYRLQYFVEVCR